MSLNYKFTYLQVKKILQAALPNIFRARLVLANNAKQVERHCYVLIVVAPNNKLIFKKSQLLNYCKEKNIRIAEPNNLKFRYYFNDFPAPQMTKEQRTVFLFRYAKMAVKDQHDNTLGFICCGKQYCRREKLEQHWNKAHQKRLA